MSNEELIKQCADLAQALKHDPTVHIESLAEGSFRAIIKSKPERDYYFFGPSSLHDRAYTVCEGRASSLEDALIKLKIDLVRYVKKEIEKLSINSSKLVTSLANLEVNSIEK